GNRRWPALPEVSQQRRDELRTEPRTLTRGQKSPLPGGASAHACLAARAAPDVSHPKWRSDAPPRARIGISPPVGKVVLSFRDGTYRTDVAAATECIVSIAGALSLPRKGLG